MADQLEYRSFLLRLWQVRSRDGMQWRASLEDSRTGVRYGFSSITRLHQFLLDQTDAAQYQGDKRLQNDWLSTPWRDDSP